jgi:cytochrome c-type biogenesis protein CcmH/NrfF
MPEATVPEATVPEATVEAPVGAPTRRPRVPLWARVLLPLLVLGVALLIGSGSLDSSPPTVAQRAAGIETGVRCPSCTDLSVAQSNATTAIAVRHQIESMVAQGSSTADIDQTLVSEYGQSILLVPPDAGGFPLIWVIPALLGAGAIFAVGVLFWRRSRQFDALREPEVTG